MKGAGGPEGARGKGEHLQRGALGAKERLENWWKTVEENAADLTKSELEIFLTQLNFVESAKHRDFGNLMKIA